MRFSAAAAFLAVLSTSDAASFFKSSSATRSYAVDVGSSPSVLSRPNGWFLGTSVRGGATGELSRLPCSFYGVRQFGSLSIHSVISSTFHISNVNRSLYRSSRRSAEQKEEEEEKGCCLQKNNKQQKFETN